MKRLFLLCLLMASPAFAAEDPILPTSNQTPIKATDADGTPVYIGDKNNNAVRITCPDENLQCFASPTREQLT
jgi:hypothetical protein